MLLISHTLLQLPVGYIKEKHYLSKKNPIEYKRNIISVKEIEILHTFLRVMVSRKGKDLLNLPIGELSEEDYNNLRYRGKRNVKPSVDVLSDSYLMSRRRRAVPGGTGMNFICKNIYHCECCFVMVQ